MNRLLVESPEYELPLNVYGYSKLLFDQRMRLECNNNFKKFKRQVVGFRYFNVYGPREQHKGRMASVAFHQFNQFNAEGKVKLFGEYGGYAQGAQMRDFVFIDDTVPGINPTNLEGTMQQINGRRMLYSNPALDITDALIERMNSDFRAANPVMTAPAATPAVTPAAKPAVSPATTTTIPAGKS